MAVLDEETGGAGVLDSALKSALRRTGASAGGVYLLAPDAPVLGLAVLAGVPATLMEPWNRVSLATPLPVADAVRENRLVWVGDQAELARAYPRAAVALPYRFALAAVPLGGGADSPDGRAAPRPGAGCHGALLLLWPGTHPPRLSARQRGSITSSGRQIARLLEEGARFADGRPEVPASPRVVPDLPGRAGAPTGAAEDFAERLPGGSAALDLEGRLTFVTAGAAELLGRPAAELLGTLPWQSLPWLDDPVYEDHYRSAVISRRPTAYMAMRPPDRWLQFRLYPDASGISVRISPAQPDGTPPTPPVRSSAPAGAGRLYQLMHLAASLTEAVGVQDVVDLVADQIMPAFGATGLVLTMADAGRLRIVGSRGYDPQTVELLDALPVNTPVTPVGEALATGIPAFYADRTLMERLYPRAAQISDKQAWAFLPLILSGRPVGCCALSYDRPHTFTADERAVLTSLAGLVAQALDRARLYDVKKDLAHGLQQALLPHGLPSPPGLEVAGRYLPATHGMDIGGDFYDVLCVDDGTCAAVIGDVQGHNVAAAALMGQVRTAVHAHTTVGTAPDKVLARTNRLLVDLDAGLLVSCLCAHLDLAHGCVTVASAGHPPPLLRRPDGATEVLSLEPGPLLGVDADAEYTCRRIPMAPGTLLALYTDGLVETPGGDIDHTIGRLAERLGRADCRDLDALIDMLVRHARPTGHHTDDIALLLLQADQEDPGGEPGPDGRTGCTGRTG